MSGGSMNYFCSQLEEYARELKDKELVEIALDLAKIFHDREWYDSADIGEGTWNQSVFEFKNKWFKESREERLERYIDESINDLKMELGIAKTCKDCKKFEPDKSGNYGNCQFCHGYMVHAYEKVCREYKAK